MLESNEAAAVSDRFATLSRRHPIVIALYLLALPIPFCGFAALDYWHHRSGYPLLSDADATLIVLCVGVTTATLHGAGFVCAAAGLAGLRRTAPEQRTAGVFAGIPALLLHAFFFVFFSQAFSTLADMIKRPNQAMQLTASKPAVYAWSVCRRQRSLRGMHRGLSAADLVSR